MDYSKELIEKLEKEYGSPLYVFDEAGFLDNFSRFESVFKNCYEKYNISYSFKTNYTPYICDLIRKQGGYAEVVSEMEYDLAVRIGFSPERIIFNGPDKTEESKKALKSGSMVNADSMEEVRAILEMASPDPDRMYRFGIRINPDIGQSFVSRFGMDEADVEKAFSLTDKVPNACINGLHCHISRCRNIEAWESRTKFMLDIADRYFEQAPEYIDLGSGMFGDMDPSLAAQFDNIPSYEEYAEATAAIFAEHYKDIPDEDKPMLFTEPGTTLINKYVSLIARVDAIKTIRGKAFAILNCSEHNLGEICTLKKVPINVIGDSKDEYHENIELSGYTCLEQDVFYSGYSGNLAACDHVVFHNVGGYSNVLKPPFIRPNCAMISARPDGSMELIKRRETPEDIFGTYVF